MTDRAVELAVEKERLLTEVEEMRHSPEERLAQVDAELAARHAEEEVERARNREEWVAGLDVYLAAQREAVEMTRQYVKAVSEAALGRRAMEAASRKPGARVSEGGQVEKIPEPISVLAERDRHLRELRADARDASSLARW
jgi:hypothetical protein